MKDSSIKDLYKHHLNVTSDWLLKSIRNGKGGSCAHFSPIMGWSNPYPETTGYLIPTLLRISKYTGNDIYHDKAIMLGDWLLLIQNERGWWKGGLHPSKRNNGSIFNTGQILKGLSALYVETQQDKYLDAASRGAAWLASGVKEDGCWASNDYKAEVTPSYYTHVTWPMLEVWSLNDEKILKDAALKVLDTILDRKKQNGVISAWGFDNTGPAFTHTIAYTIRGFQESSRLLNDYDRYSKAMEKALNAFIQKSELCNGKLPGQFDEELMPTSKYVCLTGNAQLAICILIMEQHNNDLRLVNAAAKLIDFICRVQKNRTPISGINGGVAGSFPVWGNYMFMRYPNWAAKYFCDSLLMLISRIEQEKL